MRYDKVRHDEGTAMAAPLGAGKGSGVGLMIGRCKPDQQNPSGSPFMGVERER